MSTDKSLQESADLIPVFIHQELFYNALAALERVVPTLADPQRRAEDAAAVTHLLEAFAAATQTPHVLREMLYLTVYKHSQLYGGPEGDGWYYPIVKVEATAGYYCPGGLVATYHAAAESTLLYYDMLDAIGYYFDLTHDQATDYPGLSQAFAAGKLPHIYNLNQHGEGYSIAVERVPGQAADLEHRQYEPQEE